MEEVSCVDELIGSAKATKSKTCNDAGSDFIYGVCKLHECNAGYQMKNGICEGIETLGINFEDLQFENPNHDFNDVVICLTAKPGFAVDSNRKITVLKDQDINLQISAETLCTSHVKVEIIPLTGSATVSEYNFVSMDTSKKQSTLNMKEGSQLRLTVTSSAPPGDPTPCLGESTQLRPVDSAAFERVMIDNSCTKLRP